VIELGLPTRERNPNDYTRLLTLLQRCRRIRRDASRRVRKGSQRSKDLPALHRSRGRRSRPEGLLRLPRIPVGQVGRPDPRTLLNIKAPPQGGVFNVLTLLTLKVGGCGIIIFRKFHTRSFFNVKRKSLLWAY